MAKQRARWLFWGAGGLNRCPSRAEMAGEGRWPRAPRRRWLQSGAEGHSAGSRARAGLVLGKVASRECAGGFRVICRSLPLSPPSPRPHALLLSAPCFLLPGQARRPPARHAEGGCRHSPRGRLGVPRGICAEPLVPRGAGRGTRTWAVHSQTTLLPAPGSPPPTRAGGSVALRGSGEDAGLCPHGAHTPTPRSGRLRQPLLRASGLHDDARPALGTPGSLPHDQISIGNARPNGSHGVQRRDWNCIVSSFCNELPQSIS